MVAPTMPWGKHKGERLDQIPPGYLRWVLENCDHLTLGLRRDIRWVLDELDGEAANVPAAPAVQRTDLPEVVRGWHRELVMRFHPDRGGSTEVMQAINAAADRLKELLHL